MAPTMFRSQGKCGGGHPDNLPKGTLYCLKQNTFRIIHRSLGKSEPGRKMGGGRADSGGLAGVGVGAGGGADGGGAGGRRAGRSLDTPLARCPARRPPALANVGRYPIARCQAGGPPAFANVGRCPTRSLSGLPPTGARQCRSIPHSLAAKPAAGRRSPGSVDAPIGRRKVRRGSAPGLPGRPVAHVVRPEGSAGGGGAGFSQFPVRPGPAPHLPPAAASFRRAVSRDSGTIPQLVQG